MPGAVTSHAAFMPGQHMPAAVTLSASVTRYETLDLDQIGHGQET